jgi:hypothetical protein
LSLGLLGIWTAAAHAVRSLLLQSEFAFCIFLPSGASIGRGQPVVGRRVSRFKFDRCFERSDCLCILLFIQRETPSPR